MSEQILKQPNIHGSPELETKSEIRPDTIPEFKKEEFDEKRLQMLSKYFDEVLEMYNAYLQSGNNHDLYLKLLSKLTRHRGDMGHGKDPLVKEPLSPLIKRISTKAELAITENFLDTNRLPEGGFKSGSGIDRQLSHGIAKSVFYEMIEDELFRELALLAAHNYEASILDKSDASHAAFCYELADAIKYKDKIEKLKSYKKGAGESSEEEKRRKEQELFLETQTVVNKYKEQISLESIMTDVNKINEITKTLLW